MVGTLKQEQEMIKAAETLVRDRMCSKTRTDYYSIAVYGHDLNGLDGYRKWLYEEELSAGTDPEMARINANKLVLYVNENEMRKRYTEAKKVS